VITTEHLGHGPYYGTGSPSVDQEIPRLVWTPYVAAITTDNIKEKTDWKDGLKNPWPLMAVLETRNWSVIRASIHEATRYYYRHCALAGSRYAV